MCVPHLVVFKNFLKMLVAVMLCHLAVVITTWYSFLKKTAAGFCHALTHYLTSIMVKKVLDPFISLKKFVIYEAG